jgi:hypothetical protein
MLGNTPHGAQVLEERLSVRRDDWTPRTTRAPQNWGEHWGEGSAKHRLSL